MRRVLAACAAALLAGLLYLALRTRPAAPIEEAPVPVTDRSAPVGAASPAVEPAPAVAPTGAAAPVSDAGAGPATAAALPGLDRLPAPTAPHVAASRHLSNARIAFQEDDYEVAFAQAELALRGMPDRSAARRIAALSACALGWRQDAQRHADHLERSRFVSVQAACVLDGVELRFPYAPWP